MQVQLAADRLRLAKTGRAQANLFSIELNARNVEHTRASSESPFAQVNGARSSSGRIIRRNENWFDLSHAELARQLASWANGHTRTHAHTLALVVNYF